MRHSKKTVLGNVPSLGFQHASIGRKLLENSKKYHCISPNMFWKMRVNKVQSKLLLDEQAVCWIQLVVQKMFIQNVNPKIRYNPSFEIIKMRCFMSLSTMYGRVHLYNNLLVQ